MNIHPAIRIICIMTALSLSLAQPAPAQDSLSTTAPKTSFKGRLDPSSFKDEWDFGYVPRGYKMVYKTLLHNLGKDTLQLQDVVSTCECTTPKLGHDILPPDSSAPMTIIFNTEKFSGLQSRFVEVHSSDPLAPERVLQFKAVIGGRPSEVGMLPKSLLLLDTDAGDSLVIKNYTNRDILFHPVFLDSALFELGSEFNYVPGDGYTHLYLAVRDSLPAGEFYSTLTLEFETEDTSRISLPVKLIRR